MGPLYSSIKSETYSFYYVCFTLHFEQYYENLLEIDLNCFIEKLDIFAQEQGLESVNSKQKLQTYKKYKIQNKAGARELCTKIDVKISRSTFAKFRCGILPLSIEVGRYRGVKVEDRICPLCKNGVESEIHFLFECNVYDRGNFLHEAGIDSNLLTNDDRLRIIMSKHQKATSTLVCSLWNQRQAKHVS